MLTGSLQSMINYGVMGFTPAFLMKTYGLSLSATGLQFGVLTALLGVLGPLIAGLLSDRLNKALPGAGRIWVTMFALGVSPIIALSVYRSPGPSDFYLRFTLYSLVLSMWLPPLYAVMFDQVLPRLRAITMSIYIFMMTILGLGVGPYLVGMISDANGGGPCRGDIDNKLGCARHNDFPDHSCHASPWRRRTNVGASAPGWRGRLMVIGSRRSLCALRPF